MEIVNGQRTRACIEREAQKHATAEGKIFRVYRLDLPHIDVVSFSYIDESSEHRADFDVNKSYTLVNTIRP